MDHYASLAHRVVDLFPGGLEIPGENTPAGTVENDYQRHQGQFYL